jgi:hypothetical protein
MRRAGQKNEVKTRIPKDNQQDVMPFQKKGRREKQQEHGDHHVGETARRRHQPAQNQRQRRRNRINNKKPGKFKHTCLAGSIYATRNGRGNPILATVLKRAGKSILEQGPVQE